VLKFKRKLEIRIREKKARLVQRVLRRMLQRKKLDYYNQHMD